MQKSFNILIVIIILGFLLRIIGITFNPPSLNWDEISHGYNAYSVLKTGMDQWGQRFPIFNFRAYGDYPTTLNLYLTIPFILIFGLSEFSIRFPHAILGTLTIISAYYLAFGVTNKRNTSLLTAFLIAVGPWYFFTSRFVLQSNLSVFLLTTAAALFVNRQRYKYNLHFSLLLFLLTLFSYHTTRIFSPLFLIATLLIFRREIQSKLIYVYSFLFILLTVYILFIPGATARSNQLFLLDQGAINKIEEQRNFSKLPTLVKKLVYNRPLYIAQKFTRNYFSYFSPQFLFLKGGTQYQFSLPGFGLINPLSLPLFYFGIVLLVWLSLSSKAENRKNLHLVLAWLILSPIPASLTNESYTVLRATTMLPLPEILISIAYFWLTNKLSKNKSIFTYVMFSVLILIWVAWYFNNYFNKYRYNYSWSWQYGYKNVVEFVNSNNSKYDKIVVTKNYGEPHEYFLFFLKYDPKIYLSGSSKIAYFKDNWWWVDNFDKYWFVNDWQIYTNPIDISTIQKTFNLESGQTVDCREVKCLLITSPNNAPPGWTKIKTIDFLDGKPAYELYEN